MVKKKYETVSSIPEGALTIAAFSAQYKKKDGATGCSPQNIIKKWENGGLLTHKIVRLDGTGTLLVAPQNN